jgi:hypothetical protein
MKLNLEISPVTDNKITAVYSPPMPIPLQIFLSLRSKWKSEVRKWEYSISCLEEKKEKGSHLE